jgi:glycosyltransferase involved in cell wall biosynthesis
MKILWLTHFLPYPPTGHGALQRSHHLLVGLASAHDVGLIALAPGATSRHDPLVREAESYFAPTLRFCDVHPLPFGRGGIRQRLAMLRGVVGRRTYWEHWFHDRGVAAGLRRRIEEFAPDVVHFDSVLLARYAPAVPERRLVLGHHNVESDLYAQRATVARPLVRAALAREARKLAALERRIGRQAEVNVTVSEADARRLGTLVPGARTAVVCNGVDVDFFSTDGSVTPRAGSLVFVGGMSWYPNRLAVEWLASELWPRLVEDDPDRTMTIVGSSPPASLLARAARDSRLTVTGYVDDVRPYVSSAAIFVCPIRFGGGTRLKILDALAMQRPLVSTAVGVGGLGLTEGTHYLGAETAEEFVQQISRLERDSGLRAALGRNGRALVEQRYSWSSAGRELDRAFVSAVEGRASTHAPVAASPSAVPL